MSGGSGDDRYLVDNAGDKVVEAVGGGNDSVLATVSYTLAAESEVETMRAHPATDSSSIDLTWQRLREYHRGQCGPQPARRCRWQ